MTCGTTVGVHDNLTAGQAGVTDGTTLHEATGGVNDELGVGGVQIHRAEHGGNHVLLNISAQIGQIVAGGVLARNNHGVHGDGIVVCVVAEGHLGLAVGAQVGQQAFLTHLGQTLGEAVCQPDRGGHQHVGLVRCVTEHDALVTRTLAVVVVGGDALTNLEGLIHAGVNVRGLLANRDGDTAELAVETAGRRIVADVKNGLTHDGGNLDVAGGGHLTGDVHLAGSHHGLHSNVRCGILGNNAVQDCVGNLVTNFVRMAFGHRFAGEQA